MGVKIIADSGSTKCDWALIAGNQVRYFSSSGLNPYQKSLTEIRQIVSELKVEAAIKESVGHIYFYGSGCNEAMIPPMKKLLTEIFQCQNTIVDSDLKGAALSVYDGKKGLVSILGTGSNACVFDGEKLDFVHPSLGFILGDEGSGNHIGRELLKAYYYQTMPAELRTDFETRFEVADVTVVLNRIYHQSAPSTYLASFAPWAIDNQSNDFVKNLVKGCFQTFVEVQLAGFKNSALPCHFVGSIGYVFKEFLTEVLHENLLQPGNFVKNPLPALVEQLQNQNL